MNKLVKSVHPYIYKNNSNFKTPPFKVWMSLCGKNASSHFPWRAFHGLAYRYEVPSVKWLMSPLSLSSDTAILMFVEPVSITFDAYPYYATHEVIPFIWDCWPCYYDKMEKWLRRHNVKTAIFTSSQEMAEMQRRLPNIKMLHCPEGIESATYQEGKTLVERTIDLLEFGRSNRLVVSGERLEGINHVCTKVGDKFQFTNEELYKAMGDAKITICLPKSLTHPQIAQGVETLTQRYWEAMLSRMIIVGHCPKELEDILGYNPVVEVPLNPSNMGKSTEMLILDILEHIEDYQELVDRNRKVALEMGDWKVRMEMVREWLQQQGYRV